MPVTGIVRITDTLQYIPKTFAVPKTTTEDYLHQAVGEIFAIMENPPNTVPFLSYGDEKKMRSIRFPTYCIEAHLNPACKIYPCDHCCQRLRMKIFNFRAYQ